MLEIAGQRITGNAVVTKAGDGTVTVTLSEVTAAFGDGTTPLVTIDGGSVALVLSSTGTSGTIAGRVRLQVPGIEVSGTIGLWIDTATGAAKPFEFTGSAVTVKVADQSLVVGTFRVTQRTTSTGRVTEIALAGAKLSLPGIADITVAGALVVGPGGVAGRLSAGASITIGDATLTGAIRLAVNTGTQAVVVPPVSTTASADDGLPVQAGPYLRVEGTGLTLAIGSAFSLGGAFTLERATSSTGQVRTVIGVTGVTVTIGGNALLKDVEGALVLLPGVPDPADTTGTTILVGTKGIAAQLRGTVDLSSLLPSNVTVRGDFELAINRTTAVVKESVTIGDRTVVLDLVKGQYVRVAATGVELSIAGQTMTGNVAFEQQTGTKSDGTTETVMVLGITRPGPRPRRRGGHPPRGHWRLRLPHRQRRQDDGRQGQRRRRRHRSAGRGHRRLRSPRQHRGSLGGRPDRHDRRRDGHRRDDRQADRGRDRHRGLHHRGRPEDQGQLRLHPERDRHGARGHPQGHLDADVPGRPGQPRDRHRRVRLPALRERRAGDDQCRGRGRLHHRLLGPRPQRLHPRRHLDGRADQHRDRTGHGQRRGPPRRPFLPPPDDREAHHRLRGGPQRHLRRRAVGHPRSRPPARHDRRRHRPHHRRHQRGAVRRQRQRHDLRPDRVGLPGGEQGRRHRPVAHPGQRPAPARRPRLRRHHLGQGAALPRRGRRRLDRARLPRPQPAGHRGRPGVRRRRRGADPRPARGSLRQGQRHRDRPDPLGSRRHHRPERDQGRHEAPRWASPTSACASARPRTRSSW